MKLEKKFKKGEPTGNVRVLLGETLYGVTGYKETESFIVYDTNVTALKKLFLEKIKEEEL